MPTEQTHVSTYRTKGPKRADFGVIWRDLKSSPALLITVVIGFILFLYYVYQSNVGNTVAGTNSTASPYYVAYVNDENPSAGATAIAGSTTTGTGVSGTPVAGSVRTIKLTKSGSLETTPHDSKGGKNILTVPAGASVTVIGGPVADPSGSSKLYYQVSYNGQTGYIGNDTGTFS